jgi:hypothetical protein
LNLLLDPGFETGVPWTFSGDARLEPGEGYGGSQAAYLPSGQVPVGIDPDTFEIIWGPQQIGLVWQPTTVRAGLIYPVVFFHRQYTADAAQLHCVERRADGTTLVLHTVQWPAANADWRLASFLWSPTEDNAGLGFETYGADHEFHQFVVDNVELEWVPMARGLQVVYAALFNKLKELNGSNGSYNYNLEGRVIPRLVLPDEPGAPTMPYVCLPLADNGPFLDQGERALRVALRQQIVAFLPESYKDSIEDCAAYQALQLQNDLQRCLWPDSGGQWNLDEASIEDVQFVTKETTAGQNDGIPFSEISVTVDVITRYSREDLAV